MHSIKCGHCSTYDRPVYHSNTAAVRACSRAYLASGRHAVAAQQAPVQPVQQPIAERMGYNKPRPNEWQINTPRAMVENLRDGRYAVAEQNYRGDDFDHFTFLRVWRPTSGKHKGCLLIKTQHSESYKDFIVIFPGGRVWFSQNNPRLDQALLMVCADPYTSAQNYARLHERCSCCGKKLTDERSRWYGIGPECKGRWPEIIRAVNENKGIGPNGGWFA